MGIKSKVCPKCGTINNPEFHDCWKCKASLKDAITKKTTSWGILKEIFSSVEMPKPLEYIDTNKIKNCESCNMLTPQDGLCRFCGANPNCRSGS